MGDKRSHRGAGTHCGGSGGGGGKCYSLENMVTLHFDSLPTDGLEII